METGAWLLGLLVHALDMWNTIHVGSGMQVSTPAPAWWSHPEIDGFNLETAGLSPEASLLVSVGRLACFASPRFAEP